jgi:hypothetical protein
MLFIGHRYYTPVSTTRRRGVVGCAGKPQRVVVRDAANNVIFDQVLPMDPPIPATRMGATMDSVVLPVASPVAGTPTA